MSKFKELKNDTKLMGGIYMLSLITSLLVLALVIKGPEQSGKLIVDENGNVTGISRSNTGKNENYALSLEVIDEDIRYERDISLNMQAEKKTESSAEPSEEESRESEIDSGIDMMINEIEYSRGKRITLPSALHDGTRIIWKAGEKKSDNRVILIIIIMYAGLCALMTASRMKGGKNKEEERRIILRGLPRFCNQLFLMMNAGLILSDAFDMITGSYKACDPDSLSSFERDLSELCDATDGHRISTALVINEYAARKDVKELIRIAAILTENEKRGSDVVGSLAEESRYLWDERKIVARESGKMIDTRMAYPLGLLLILLIVITMAPALLAM